MAQARAQEILDVFTDGSSKNELESLTRMVTGGMVHLMVADPNAARAVGDAIGHDEKAVDNILKGIGNGTMTNLSASIAAQPNIHDGINRVIAVNLQPGGLITKAITAATTAAGSGAPVAVVAGSSAPGLALVAPAGQRIPCGTPATLNDGHARVVRAGFCFPDEDNGCNGSILVDPSNPSKEIETKDIFMRDSLFVNFGHRGNNTLSRNLTAITDITSGEFLVEDAADPNNFNYRYFFMVDPSSKNITANKNTQINLVKLRYAVGKSYTRLSPNLNIPPITAGVPVTAMEQAEIVEAKKTIGTFSMARNWMICPEFFTYRMLPLKRGFMSANEFNRINSRIISKKRHKCIGITPPGMEAVNDVYVYTFVDQTGNYVTKDIPINNKVRREDNSFGPGDLPYEDGFFMFPKGFEDTVVSARFPDGILLFSYRGILSPIAPFGTVVFKSKLHEVNNQRSGYPDQATHVAITTALSGEMVNVNTNIPALNALTVRMNERDIRLDSSGVAVLKDIIIGGIGYITMMRVIKEIVAAESSIVFSGGRHKFMTRGRRRHNKSVKRNRMKSKSKGMTKSKGRGRGRGRARTASMLKSAKQRFYKAGGGGSMGLGFGPSVPQPLQNESPLVSQASPV